MGVKLVSSGVGKTGTAGEGTLCNLGAEDTLLIDVFVDVSWPSTPPALRLLLLRLEEEKFFLSPMLVLPAKRTGEPGIEDTMASLSAEITFVRPEVVEDSTSPGSDPVKGKEFLRLGGSVAEPRGNSLMVGLCRG